MTLRTVLRDVQLSENIGVFYLKKTNRSSGWGISISQIKFLEVTEAMRVTVRGIITNYINWILSERVEANYSIDDVESNRHYFNLDSDSISNFQTIITAINNLQNNRSNQLFASNIRNLDPNMYVIRITFGGRDYFFFKNYHAATLLKKTTFLNLEQEDIDRGGFITIKNSLDCLYDPNNDTMYIFKKSNFETIFNYKDDYRNRASMLLEQLNNESLIVQNEYFASECLRLETRVKKLARIFNEDKLSKLLTHRNNIQQVIDNFDLNLELNRNNRIVLHPESNDTDLKRKEIDDLLNILDLSQWENALTKERAQQAIPQYNQLSLLVATH